MSSRAKIASGNRGLRSRRVSAHAEARQPTAHPASRGKPLQPPFRKRIRALRKRRDIDVRIDSAPCDNEARITYSCSLRCVTYSVIALQSVLCCFFAALFAWYYEKWSECDEALHADA